MIRKREVELAERVKELEAFLGIEPLDFEEWMIEAPQAWRDKLAATIYFQSYGHTAVALKRLGIKYKVGAVRETSDKVFMTPGCQAIINRDISDANACKPAIVERLTHQALHADDENANKATSLLARICGWIKEPTLNVDNRRINLYQLSGSHEELPKPEDRPALEGFLDHEPGEAVRVSSDERIDKLLQEVESG